MRRPRDEDLEEPQNLGAPARPYWSPGVRRYVGRSRTRMDFESGRMVLMTLLAGASFVAAIVIIGSLAR